MKLRNAIGFAVEGAGLGQFDRAHAIDGWALAARNRLARDRNPIQGPG